MLRLAMLFMIIVELALWVAPMLPPAKPAKPAPLDSTVVCPTRACKHWWIGGDRWYAGVAYEMPGWDFAIGIRFPPSPDVCNLSIGKPRHGKKWLLQYTPDGKWNTIKIVTLQSSIQREH